MTNHVSTQASETQTQDSLNLFFNHVLTAQALSLVLGR